MDTNLTEKNIKEIEEIAKSEQNLVLISFNLYFLPKLSIFKYVFILPGTFSYVIFSIDLEKITALELQKNSLSAIPNLSELPNLEILILAHNSNFPSSI